MSHILFVETLTHLTLDLYCGLDQPSFFPLLLLSVYLVGMEKLGLSSQSVCLMQVIFLCHNMLTIFDRHILFFSTTRHFFALSYRAVLVGSLNDRLLLASPTEINPRQKKRVEIKSCLVGLLEPILIGFATMQLSFEQKLDLSEVLYQITSRFPSFFP